MSQSLYTVAVSVFDGDHRLLTISDGNKRDRSLTWSVVADAARPPHTVSLRGDNSEEESNGGCGEAPVLLCVLWY